MTTFETAKRCPKCEQPGEDVQTMRGSRPGVLVHTIFCRNQVCIWLNTSWLVQVNEDGSVPEAYQQLGPKSFPKLSPEAETRVQEALATQLKAETQPGAEVRNPRSN
jgi:hypothetical protein